MLKKIVFAGVGLAMLCMPVVASAQTQGSNASLIALLTQLVQRLEQELAALQSGAAQNNNGTATNPIYFGGSGPCMAVGGEYCGSTSPATSTSSTASQGATLSVTPQSGRAPLAVSFTSTLNGTIQFGDGNTGTLMANPIPEYACAIQNLNCVNPVHTYSTSYTYQDAGTYIASVTNGTQTVSATIYVTATGSTTPPPAATSTSGVSLTASPMSGPVPLQVQFSVSGLPVPPVYSPNQSSTYTLVFGNGAFNTFTNLSCPTQTGSVSCSGTMNQMFFTPGTYVVTLQNYTYNPYKACTQYINAGCLGQGLASVTITATAAAPAQTCATASGAGQTTGYDTSAPQPCPTPATQETQ